jgi:hypothetical protein
MNETRTQDVCTTLTEILRRFPDFRFGQLVCNMASLADVNVWDLEDDQLLEVAARFLERHRDREPAAAATNPDAA